MAKLLENGKYRGRATLMELGLSKKNTEQVAIVFELLDDGFSGESITYYGSFSEAAFEHTLRAMRNAGWASNDLNDLALVDPPEVELVIQNEEYEGKTHSKVRWVNLPGEGAARLATPLQADQQKSFAARMKAKIAAFDRTAGKRPTKSNRPPEPPPPTDADAPPY